jgi:hypothetical protein
MIFVTYQSTEQFCNKQISSPVLVLCIVWKYCYVFRPCWVIIKQSLHEYVTHYWIVRILFLFYFLNEIYNLNVTVKNMALTERKFINHRSGAISVNNPTTSDIHVLIA